MTPPYAGCHTDPNTVYQNFKQDCHYFDLHGVTYEQYIVSIIDKIISQSDCAETSIESADPETFDAVNTNFEDRLNTVDMAGANCLPLKIQGNFALAIDDHTGTSPSLNLEAWDKYLHHYPHRIVLQYLKFGFPLSIGEPDALTNTVVTNHFSAPWQ